jgi:hypothetical protein
VEQASVPAKLVEQTVVEPLVEREPVGQVLVDE